MATVVLDPQPPEIAALIARRQKLDLDRLDEMWEGVYHMNPAPHSRHARIVQQLAELIGEPARAAGLVPVMSVFNLGVADDYRVPDGGVLRPGPDAAYHPTAAIAVEILSPGDETWEKLPFYAAHDVDELLIVDPETRAIRWMALDGGAYSDVQTSALLALGPAELTTKIDWP